MSWLNANEYFLMEMIARERVEELGSAVDLTPAKAEASDPPSPCPGSTAAHHTRTPCVASALA
jgi:hypothetical protein